MLDREQLTLVDCDDYYVRLVGRRWGHLANVRCLARAILGSGFVPEGATTEFDSVVCVNALERWEQPGRRAKLGFSGVGGDCVLVPASPCS